MLPSAQRAVRRGCQRKPGGSAGAERRHGRRTEDPPQRCTPREEVRSVLITRQALCRGPVPVDIGALDAKGGNASKSKERGQGQD